MPPDYHACRQRPFILILVRLITVLFLAALGLGADSVPLSEYRARRDALRKSLEDAVVILFGGSERDSGDLRTGFFQDANFFYLTGWMEPNAVMLLGPDGETLLLPRRSERRERYTGRKLDPGDADAKAVTGFDSVQPVESLESLVLKQIEHAQRIYILTEQPAAQKLKALVPMRELSDAAPAIARLRMKKSAAELALLQKSIDASVEAHRAAWKRIEPGLYEYQLAASMTAAWMDRGCERGAYPPIIGSGPNATVLHYSRNSRRMDRGELVVMDAAAECSMYAADITRTIPVSRKFDQRQKELYRIVLGAQQAVIAALKPGVTIDRNLNIGLNKIARDYMDAHGKDSSGAGLGKYMTHGVSHHVGLDVHDANDPAAALASGMVITVEPGLYIPEERIGIRIEDMVLITETGARVLTSALPKEPDEIERALAAR